MLSEEASFTTLSKEFIHRCLSPVTSQLKDQNVVHSFLKASFENVETAQPELTVPYIKMLETSHTP